GREGRADALRSPVGSPPISTPYGWSEDVTAAQHRLHEPFCTSDTAATAEAMQNSVRKNGTPIFDTRDRQDGSVWIRWSPDTYEGVGAGPLSSSNMARSGSTSHREHARSGPSVSTASANGVDHRPLLGRVGADGPEIPRDREET